MFHGKQPGMHKFLASAPRLHMCPAEPAPDRSAANGKLGLRPHIKIIEAHIQHETTYWLHIHEMGMQSYAV